MVMAFDPSVIFAAFKSLFDFGTAISPAINAWIEARIPEEKQQEMVKRMKQCKRICHREKLSADLIPAEVRSLFSDLPEHQADITALIINELNLAGIPKMINPPAPPVAH